MLICPPGTERLDITLDKCAVEQKWQDAGEDKMPSARVFYSLSVIVVGQQLVRIPKFVFLFPMHTQVKHISPVQLLTIVHLMGHYDFCSPFWLKNVQMNGVAI